MNAINLELTKSEYTSGDLIAGTVTVELDQSIPVRGVRVRFKGYEEACWSSGSGRSRHTHKERKVHFQDELTLYGRPPLALAQLAADSVQGFFSTDNYEQLHPGTHRYEFSYQLPAGLPGDYESNVTRSEIKYEVLAYVDLPIKSDLEARQRLAVIERGDAGIGDPVIASNRKSFLFESQSSLEAAFHLQKSAFVLGEKLSGRLVVANHSSKQVKGARVELQRVERLRAGASSHENVATICSEVFPGCVLTAREEKDFPIDLHIPPDLWPSIQQGTLVRVDYQLRVALEVPWAVDLKVIAPIVLLETPGALKAMP